MADERSAERPSVARRRATRTDRILWPWTLILLITGAFHLYRGAIADGVIFLAVAAALIADAAGWLHLAPQRPGGQPALPHLAIAALIVVVPLSLSPLFSATNALVLIVVGIAALAVAWPRTAGAKRVDARRAPMVRRTAVLWAWVGLAFCAWELVVYFLGRPSAAAELAFPPLSDLLDPLIATPFWRVLLIVAWLAGGAALLRRGRHP